MKISMRAVLKLKSELSAIFKQAGPRNVSCTYFELNDVSITNNIFAAFKSCTSVFTAAFPSAKLNKIVKRRNFSFYKFFHKICMNFTCGSERGGTESNCPGPNFLLPTCQERNQTKLFVRFLNKPLQT